MNQIPVVTHDEVSEWSVDRIHAFVCHPSSCEVQPATTFSWDLFSSMMETNYSETRDVNPEEAAKWAEIIIRIDDELARLCCGISSLSSNGFEHRAMYLRSWLILRYGACPGDRYRDPQVLERWFMLRLPRKDDSQSLADQFCDWLAAQRRVEVLCPLQERGLLSDDFPLNEWAATIAQSVAALSGVPS